MVRVQGLEFVSWIDRVKRAIAARLFWGVLRRVGLVTRLSLLY